MKIYNIIQSILNTKSTIKHKVLCIYYGILNKNIAVGYHSSKISLIKKLSIWWGMMPIFFYKSMSDNKHYVNLISNQHKSNSKVGNNTYFVRLLRKITRWGGIIRGAIIILPKNLKSLIIKDFGRRSIKKGLDMCFGLCKLRFQNGGIIKNGGLGLFGQYEIHCHCLPNEKWCRWSK